MDQAAAERWVTISAFVVLLVYGYRRVTEQAQPGGLKNVLGQSPPVPLGQFVTSWGVVYFVVSIMASASPSLGGSFAILIMAADLLNNLQAVTADLKKGQQAGAGQVNVATGATSSAPVVGAGTITAGSQGFSNAPSISNPYQNVTGPALAPQASPSTPEYLPSSGPYGGGTQP